MIIAWPAMTMSLPKSKRPLPGFGVFPVCESILCLTAPFSTRSRWRLPKWFLPSRGKTPLSRHADVRRWHRTRDWVYSGHSSSRSRVRVGLQGVLRGVWLACGGLRLSGMRFQGCGDGKVTNLANRLARFPVFLNELIFVANYARIGIAVSQAVFSFVIDSGASWSVWRGV